MEDFSKCDGSLKLIVKTKFDIDLDLNFNTKPIEIQYKKMPKIKIKNVRKGKKTR